jgi:DNA-binding transcriptional LysR family regulator
MDLMRRGIKLSHLRLIAALSDTGQMSAAAAQLSISQPAASRLAAELETILGVSLHVRHPRGITLTRYGEYMAARAQTILRGLHDAGREISELRTGFRGSVSVGSVTGPAVELVLPVVKLVRSTHPQLSISVSIDTSDTLADAFLAGTLDFYLGRIPDSYDLRLFNARIIGKEPIALMVRPDHPLTKISDISLHDLLGFDWVMQDQGSLMRRTVETYLVEHGAPLPEKVLNTASILFTLVTVSQTDAISPIARSVFKFISSKEGLSSNLASLNVAPDLAVSPCYLISKASETLSPAAQIVYDAVANGFSNRDTRREMNADSSSKFNTEIPNE